MWQPPIGQYWLVYVKNYGVNRGRTRDLHNLPRLHKARITNSPPHVT
jgi:hypothetical protein